MKKSLWILTLIILFLLGDRVGGLFLKNIAEKSQFRYSRLYAGEAKSDVLFVGNSRGLMFYQPYIEEKSKLSTLNISYNGLPMDLANVLIQDQIDINSAPKLMIIDITICDRFNPQLLSGFNFYQPFSERLSELLRKEVPKTYYGGFLSHLFRHNSEIFNRALYYLNILDEDWLLDRVITDKIIKGIEEREAYKITIDDHLINELKSAINYAKSKGVEVKLLVNPYFPKFADKVSNLDEVIEKVEIATNLKVSNYAYAVEDEKGFGDSQHLNKHGSRLFLDILIEDDIFDFK